MPGYAPPRRRARAAVPQGVAPGGLRAGRLSRRLALSAFGAVLLGLAALIATAAVWRWDRTHVVLTTEKLFIAHGVVRRRAASVQLARVGAVEVDQSLTGRLFGYGTLVAGDLEISAVPKPRQFAEMLA